MNKTLWSLTQLQTPKYWHWAHLNLSFERKSRELVTTCTKGAETIPNQFHSPASCQGTCHTPTEHWGILFTCILHINALSYVFHFLSKTFWTPFESLGWTKSSMSEVYKQKHDVWNWRNWHYRISVFTSKAVEEVNIAHTHKIQLKKKMWRIKNSLSWTYRILRSRLANLTLTFFLWNSHNFTLYVCYNPCHVFPFPTSVMNLLDFLTKIWNRPYNARVWKKLLQAKFNTTETV